MSSIHSMLDMQHNRLRDTPFSSFTALNAAIAQGLVRLNEKVMSGC